MAVRFDAFIRLAVVKRVNISEADEWSRIRSLREAFTRLCVYAVPVAAWRDAWNDATIAHKNRALRTAIARLHNHRSLAASRRVPLRLATAFLLHRYVNLWSWAATHRRSERLLFSRNQRIIAFRRFLNAIRAVAASSKVFSDCNVLAQRTDLATAFLKLDQWASKLSHTSGACVLLTLSRDARRKRHSLYSWFGALRRALRRRALNARVDHLVIARLQEALQSALMIWSGSAASTALASVLARHSLTHLRMNALGLAMARLLAESADGYQGREGNRGQADARQTLRNWSSGTPLQRQHRRSNPASAG